MQQKLWRETEPLALGGGGEKAGGGLTEEGTFEPSSQRKGQTTFDV